MSFHFKPSSRRLLFLAKPCCSATLFLSWPSCQLGLYGCLTAQSDQWSAYMASHRPGDAASPTSRSPTIAVLSLIEPIAGQVLNA